MAHVNPDCKTREELERRLAAGEVVEVFRLDQEGIPKYGTVELAGPVGSDRWRATGIIEEGRLILVA